MKAKNYVEPLVFDEFLPPYAPPIKPFENKAMLASARLFDVKPPSLESFCRFELAIYDLQMTRLNHIFYQLNCMIRAIGLPQSIVFRDSTYPKWVGQRRERDLDERFRNIYSKI